MQKLLVVEDDLDIQELLQNFLQEAGYRVTAANDGVEAVSLFSGSPFDLILLDVMLPKIDGFTVCECIRQAVTGSDYYADCVKRRRRTDTGTGFTGGRLHYKAVFHACA